MKQFLPARPSLLSVLLLLLALLARPAFATHLLGGELTYRFLDADGPDATPLRYELTLTVYNNCGNTTPAPTSPYLDADIGIFNRGTNTLVRLTAANTPFFQADGTMTIPQTSISPCISPGVQAGCTITGPSQPYKLQKFIAVVSLPDNGQGFYAVYSESARNGDITNIPANAQPYLEIYTSMAPRTQPNRSPLFANVAVAVLCAGDTTFYLNNAIDADGDRLEYSFGRPFVGTIPTAGFSLPQPVITYANATYSANTPFGAVSSTNGVISTLNANTGIATLATPNQGKYVIAVDVREYRTIGGQEVLIGSTRRDVMLVVSSCPPVSAPKIPPPVVTGGGGPVAPLPREYTLIAGTKLTIPFSATQSDNHPLTFTLSSELLDGIGGYIADFNGNAGTVTGVVGTASVTSPAGTPSVSGTFTYTAACDAIRTTPYDIVASVQDNGCAGKTIYDVFRVTVVAPTGPTAIAGDDAVCGLTPVGSTVSYAASGGTATNVQWSITGGVIVGSTTANPVQVRWTTVGTGTISVQGSSPGACAANTVTKSVSVRASPTLTIPGGNRAICAGTSTTITVGGGGTGAVYTVTGGPVSGTSPTFTLTPTATTTYTIASTATGACPGTTTLVVTVNPLPVANVGAPTRTTCSGVPLTLGAAAVAGTTYSWTPTTGLSSATVANPTLTLTSPTVLTQVYTLTATTTAGCVATNAVTVTVTPAAVATVGPAVTICSGASAVLGGPAVAGSTYSWTPTTGLSSATVANPTITLNNTTTAPVTQTYTLTVTTAAGCTATNTVAVTVNPAVAANVGAPTRATCSGVPLTLGAAAVAGSTYSWTPTNGLSSATVANPTLTLTSSSSTPITQSYTLTETSAQGCVASNTVVITINPAAAAVAGPARAICSGASATLGAAAVTGYTYTWTPATGLSSATVANPTVTLQNTTTANTTQTYTLTATNGTGCVATSTVVVTVYPVVAPTVPTTATTIGGKGVTIGTTPVAGFTYSWSPATDLSSSTVANPTVLLVNYTGAPITRTYTVTATNTATGCTGTATVTVTINVDQTLTIYNVITPNGDKLNDKLQILNVLSFPGNTMEIYNRWGRQVFTTTNYNNDTNAWGEDPSIAPGTYYYLFKQANGSTTKGWVEVIK